MTSVLSESFVPWEFLCPSIYCFSVIFLLFSLLGSVLCSLCNWNLYLYVPSLSASVLCPSRFVFSVSPFFGGFSFSRSPRGLFTCLSRANHGSQRRAGGQGWWNLTYWEGWALPTASLGWRTRSEEGDQRAGNNSESRSSLGENGLSWWQFGSLRWKTVLTIRALQRGWCPGSCWRSRLAPSLSVTLLFCKIPFRQVFIAVHLCDSLQILGSVSFLSKVSFSKCDFISHFHPFKNYSSSFILFFIASLFPAFLLS